MLGDFVDLPATAATGYQTSAVPSGTWTGIYDRLGKEQGAWVVVSTLDTTAPLGTGGFLAALYAGTASGIPPVATDTALRWYSGTLNSNVQHRIFVPAAHILCVFTTAPNEQRITVAVETTGVLPAVKIP